MSNQDGFYKIRPAARIIHTIGKDLIGDSYAALVELVKNSYDADAKEVNVTFEYLKIEGKSALRISIEDDGHGMDFNTVETKWLVPATNDKLKRERSPGKRFLQGRKGIGRFAASILGQEMTLVTTAKNKEVTSAVIDWRIFDTDEFLENVDILLESEKSEQSSGTLIQIIAKDEIIEREIDSKIIKEKDNKLSYWTESTFEALENELRRLISPFQEYSEDDFQINLSILNSPFENEEKKQFKIETYPIIKLYDYRISGSIDNLGRGNFIYENNVDGVSQTEKITTNYKIEGDGTFCGEINVDFRVFDREPEAIQNLINKGLIDPISKKYMGRQDTRRLLNEVYGVNVYRNNFRVRPYGNGGIDWLDLDKKRIQNFTISVSNNQVVGFVTIEAEEKSGLEEKSARDGLKENEAYFGLKELCNKALRELETRRLSYRKRTLKSRKSQFNTTQTLDELFSFSSLRNSVGGQLKSFGISSESIDKVFTIIQKEEQKKTKLLEDIQKTIAIYQGQATLGKIVSFILHEGRKPIHFFRNESPLIKKYLKVFKDNPSEDLYEDMIDSLDGFEKNSTNLAQLFRRINPLASQSRGKKSSFNVEEQIKQAQRIFNHVMVENQISFELICDSNITLYGWSNDLQISFANLFENSIYWLNLSDKTDKKIEIAVKEGIDSLLIYYQDNGPGITVEEIKSEVIFEPGYSKKMDGTGLGLAIAGEAIERLNGKLIAQESESGAYFQIEINTKK